MKPHPPEALALLEAVVNEGHEILVAVQFHDDLFSSDGTIGLLNATAPAFFGRIQNVLIDSVILALSRLTDDEKTGRFENATLGRLIDISFSSGASSAKDALIADLNKLKDKCKDIREHRRKRIAHKDYQHSTTNLSLPAVTKATVAECAQLTKSIIIASYQQMKGEQLSYFLTVEGGTKELIRQLVYAARWRHNESKKDDLNFEVAEEEIETTDWNTFVHGS